MAERTEPSSTFRRLWANTIGLAMPCCAVKETRHDPCRSDVLSIDTCVSSRQGAVFGVRDDMSAGRHRIARQYDAIRFADSAATEIRAGLRQVEFLLDAGLEPSRTPFGRETIPIRVKPGIRVVTLSDGVIIRPRLRSGSIELRTDSRSVIHVDRRVPGGYGTLDPPDSARFRSRCSLARWPAVPSP